MKNFSVTGNSTGELSGIRGAVKKGQGKRAGWGTFEPKGY